MVASLLRLTLILCCLLPWGVVEAVPAHFGLFIGNNHWVPAPGATRLPELHHADDDALMGATTFQMLHPDGTSWLLTDPDDATRRSRPELTGMELRRPTRVDLDQVLVELKAMVVEAKRQGHHPIQLFVHFSGHGEQGGQLHLADARIGAEALLTRLTQLGADTTFALMDACYLGRILKGSEEELITRQPLFGAPPLLNGLFLLGLTTAAPEYAELEGGLLSLVALTGLRGPADRDGDGVITFREWKLFVAEQLESFPDPPGLRARDLEPQRKVVVGDLRGVDLGGILVPRSTSPGLLRVTDTRTGGLVSELMIHGDRPITLYLPPGTYHLLFVPTPRSWDQRGGIDATEVRMQVFRRVLSLPTLPGQVTVKLEVDHMSRGEAPAGEWRGLSLQDEVWIQSRLRRVTPPEDPTPEGTWVWLSGGIDVDSAGGYLVPGGQPIGPGRQVGAGRIVPGLRIGGWRLGLGGSFTYMDRGFDRLCSTDEIPLCVGGDDGEVVQHTAVAGPELGWAHAGPHIRLEGHLGLGLALTWLSLGGEALGPGDLAGQAGEDYLLASTQVSGGLGILARVWDDTSVGPVVVGTMLVPVWNSPRPDRPVEGIATQVSAGIEISHQF